VDVDHDGDCQLIVESGYILCVWKSGRVVSCLYTRFQRLQKI